MIKIKRGPRATAGDGCPLRRAEGLLANSEARKESWRARQTSCSLIDINEGEIADK